MLNEDHLYEIEIEDLEKAKESAKKIFEIASSDLDSLIGNNLTEALEKINELKKLTSYALVESDHQARLVTNDIIKNNDLDILKERKDILNWLSAILLDVSSSEGAGDTENFNYTLTRGKIELLLEILNHKIQKLTKEASNNMISSEEAWIAIEGKTR